MRSQHSGQGEAGLWGDEFVLRGQWEHVTSSYQLLVTRPCGSLILPVGLKRLAVYTMIWRFQMQAGRLPRPDGPVMLQRTAENLLITLSGSGLDLITRRVTLLPQKRRY